MVAVSAPTSPRPPPTRPATSPSPSRRPAAAPSSRGSRPRRRRARVALPSARSSPIRIRSAVAFRGATIDVRVQPSTWTGRVLARTRVGDGAPARAACASEGPRAVVVPAPALGRMRVVVEVPALGPYAADHREAQLQGRPAAGSPRARPAPTSACCCAASRSSGSARPASPRPCRAQATDSIVAFQKAYRLPRTYVFDGDDWRGSRRPAGSGRASGARRCTSRSTRRARSCSSSASGRVVHILPDLDRRHGQHAGGPWKIRWKAPSTTTWLGSAILFRTMTFKGNEFAIHGFSPVPSYAASHGCARIPMWAATGSTASRRSARRSTCTASATPGARTVPIRTHPVTDTHPSLPARSARHGPADYVLGIARATHLSGGW